MKYYKNIGTMLEALGFKFKDEHSDNEIKYEVRAKKDIEVTIDHTNEMITVSFHEIDLKGIKDEGALLDFEHLAYGENEK